MNRQSHRMAERLAAGHMPTSHQPLLQYPYTVMERERQAKDKRRVVFAAWGLAAAVCLGILVLVGIFGER